MCQKRDNLTTRQKEVLEFMIAFRNSEGYAPSLTELSEGLHIVKSTAHTHVKKLEEKGYIATQERKTRAIKFLKEVIG